MSTSSRIFSELSKCTCASDEIDFSDAQLLVEEVIVSLKAVNDDFHKATSDSCDCKSSRNCVLQTALFTLQNIDSKLNEILDLINEEPKDDDEIVSNFGMSVKAEMATQKLNESKEKHDRLRTEWYSQDAHLNKIAGKVKEKENELKQQSIFCTTQGLVLSRMLWKSSQSNPVLDKIVVHEEMINEFLKIFNGCLYGFVQTYKNDVPESSAEEYQFVLSLCGIFSNFASVPDGRYQLTSQTIFKDVLNQIVNVLPKTFLPNAGSLKWILLTAIYNVMICKEGKEHARNNRKLLVNLGKCLKQPNPHRIIMLALKIINNLTDEISSENYMRYVNQSLPFGALEELQRSKESVTIRKQAKDILSGDMGFSKYFCNLGQTSKSKLNSCLAKNRQVLAYYVFTDPPTEENISDTRSGCSSDTTSMNPSTPSTESVTSKRKSNSTSASSIISEDNLTVNTKKKLILSKSGEVVESGGSSNLKISTPAISIKECVVTHPINKNFNCSVQSGLCCPSTCSAPTVLPKQACPVLENTGSEEGNERNVRSSMSCMDLKKNFSTAVRDANINNVNKRNDFCSSVVTIYQLPNMSDFISSESSFNPFFVTTGTNTSLASIERHSVNEALQTSRRLFTTLATAKTIFDCWSLPDYDLYLKSKADNQIVSILDYGQSSSVSYEVLETPALRTGVQITELDVKESKSNKKINKKKSKGPLCEVFRRKKKQ